MYKLVFRFIVLFFLGLFALSTSGNTIRENLMDEAYRDSARKVKSDTLTKWMKQKVSDTKKVVHKFNDIDTTYIEPQKYNFTFMLQNTTTYEIYKLNGSTGQSITFAPESSIKIGPYFGWRWLFLGYTIDVRHLDLFKKNSQRLEYDLSLYSSMIGIDIYYRKSGDDYKITHADLGEDIDTKPLKGVSFGGLTSSIKGFNVYYIFNHRKFSYPAAFSQSTIQRRSAGSPLIGIGYTKHMLSVNWDNLNDLVKDKLHNTYSQVGIDTTMMFNRIKYVDVSVSGGYAYNWVFAHNWLLAGSLSLALAYKTSKGDTRSKNHIGNFDFKNINLDGIGRFGIVYNNSKYYAGMSAIIHAYNYKKKTFSTNNVFGSLNIYAGFNFGSKAKHHNRKKKKPNN